MKSEFDNFVYSKSEIPELLFFSKLLLNEVLLFSVIQKKKNLSRENKRNFFDVIKIFSKIELKCEYRILNFNENAILIKSFRCLFLLTINLKILFILKKVSIIIKNCNLFFYINYVENKFIDITKYNVKFLLDVVLIENESKK